MLQEMPVVEQRYQAVLAVREDGLAVTEVAEKIGVSRQSLHGWLRRYAAGGLDALADRSHRPRSCPHQMNPDVQMRHVLLPPVLVPVGTTRWAVLLRAGQSPLEPRLVNGARRAADRSEPHPATGGQPTREPSRRTPGPSLARHRSCREVSISPQRRTSRRSVKASWKVLPAEQEGDAHSTKVGRDRGVVHDRAGLGVTPSTGSYRRCRSLQALRAQGSCYRAARHPIATASSASNAAPTAASGSR